MHHNSTVYTEVNKGSAHYIVDNGIVSDRRPVIRTSSGSGVIGKTQALILRFVEKTDITMFTVAMVATWLREQGIKISRDAVRKALERLADRGLATDRNGWRSVGVDRPVSMKIIPKRREQKQTMQCSLNSPRIFSRVEMRAVYKPPWRVCVRKLEYSVHHRSDQIGRGDA